MKKILGNRTGFTMIELLVVIAVIGVLAVAVLSSINPVEQINKGRDTRLRSDATQLVAAIDRYYAAQIEPRWPWQDADPTTYPTPTTAFECLETTLDNCGDDSTVNGTLTFLDELVNSNEVKANFVDRIRADARMYVYKPAGDDDPVYVCFNPVSQQFSNEASEACANGETPTQGSSGPTLCPTLPSDNAYICLP